MAFATAFLLFVIIEAAQISPNVHEQQLNEQAQRTKIISYQKDELTEKRIFVAIDTMKKKFKCNIEHLPFLGVFIITFEDLNDALACSSTLPDDVVVASDALTKVGLGDMKNFGSEPEFKVFKQDGTFNVSSRDTPDDPRFGGQWSLQDQPNQADINAQEAWEEYQNHMKSKKGQDVIVAVIDTGVDFTHEDLKHVMWNNPNEIPGNGIDDDGNGIIDDIHGANFVDYGEPGNPMDDYGHGTHCAGIIKAEANNEKGVAGVASFSNDRIKVMALKVIPKFGGMLETWALKALEYAGSHGALISSHSYQLSVSDERLWTDIMRKHPEQLYIAAAGNNGVEMPEGIKIFPCCLKEPNMLCVANSNIKDKRSLSSNYGKEYVHVFAPGEDILSTMPNNEYKNETGTSMAAPHVSGLAALVMSMRSNADGQDALAVKDLILKNVQKKEQYEGLVSSGGLIDMEKTIRSAKLQKRFQN